MPEGPSIVILKELVKPFENKKVIAVTGNSKEDIQRIADQKIIGFKSWGKHFLICFHGFSVRIHFLLFGSYRINEEKDASPRLRLTFRKGFISFYACSLKIIDTPLDEIYDWDADIMADEWNAKAARKKLMASPEMLACDALLNQNIFSGSGNIIKNEVLYRTKIHPLSIIKCIPSRKLSELIREVRNYSFDFLHWKKEYTLKKHWLAHTKKKCLRCNLPIIKEHLGKTRRRTFYCQNCQQLYDKC
ncbi:endonuclease [Pollutibacter soli]|uniref:endonuclease n=1 Tax=Pollutibacter soli TaxID=3034157 RepID=UPI00301367EA